MNILYINHYAGAPAYGMEFRPYYLAREWVKAGHQVTIVAASRSHVRSINPNVDSNFTEENIEGIRYVWCRTPEYSGNGIGRVINIFSFLHRLYQHRRWLQARPDVVIASSTYPLDIWPAQSIARRYGAKLIWELHDLWPLSPIELGGMSRWHPFIMLLQRAENTACRVAERIVSMLPNADRHLQQHGMAEHKFVYIPNGIDPDEWNLLRQDPLPKSHQTAIELAKVSGELLVAYAGSHGVANALDTLIDAAVLCQDQQVRFLLVGNGTEKQGLIIRAQKLGLKNIEFLEPISKAMIPVFLRQMDLLYIGWQRSTLYRFGISPNKLMDYMMAGKPVIHAVDAANDPILDAGAGVSIQPEDPKAFADAISQLSALSSEQRQKLGSAGQRYITEKNLYPILAQHFLAVMESSNEG